ncbi:MAG: bifunctional D-glycero-beta-D-manno-heptose-7-phosphate kinase/D-glycero-beta-D-manno-heptose 1-phosphate adenylyltransferase HldE [Gammaproteobacteria bacterium]|nr:bifunctional D-glycero-beta-D-manno-heptose-7-phosphate kinase/D-glycero-beta-D-manno-heptose 1-phosphate adenylyltransferase HldE [Gammaproteobacteria bacterium]
MSETIYSKSLKSLSIEKASVLVVGDVMLDQYWQGSTDRISPEAPVPVVNIKEKSMRVGGSGNVAVNITSLGGKAYLVGMMGKDEAAKDLSSLLNEHGVMDHCVKSEEVSTTIKLRVLAQHQQLIRLDFEANVSQLNQQVIESTFDDLLSKVNMLVLSDYGKGVVADTAKYIKQANQHNVKVLVDPKKNDFSAYAGAYLITPNKKEFEAVVGACNDQTDLESKARGLIEQHNLGGLLVTQGEHGMTLIMKDESAVHFPTHAREVYDVTGAGDTVIASLAAGISAGMKVEDAVHLSCVAAGIVVGRIGTAKVTQEDILNIEEHNIADSALKVTSESDLLAYVRQAKEAGKKVVFSNGCFDILHAGHVQYLQQAASLGDVFILAVNSDRSVKALKGETRPINPLDNRMAVLAGLSSIDRVVSFDEDTPERLICEIKPDVLVKGGDYQVDQIAGRDCSGEVVLVDFIKGQSSSNIINQIKTNND